MKITRLRLSNYRRFSEVELTFTEGLNLVRGPNESGKSTIVGALMACIFEKPQARNERIRGAHRWGAAERPRVEVEFVHGGNTYRLVKDFESGKAVLERPEGGERLDTAKSVQSRLAGFTGFGDPERYERTACVTHDQMVGIAGDRSAGKLAADLREIVVGTGESAVMESAIGELSAEVDELKRGLERPAKNPGTVARLRSERRGVESRRREIEEEIAERRKNSARLEEVEGLLGEKSVRLEELGALLEKNRELSELEKNIEASRERFGRASAVKQAQADLENAEKEIDVRYPGFRDIDPRLESELKSDIDQVRTKSELAGRLQSELSGLRGQARPAPARAPGLLALVLGVASVGAGAYLGTVRPWLFLLVALGLALLGAGVLLLRPSLVRHGDRTAAYLERRLAEAEREVSTLGRQLARLLEPLGFSDAGTFLEEFSEYSRLASDRDRLAAGLEALRANLGTDDIEGELGDAALELAARQERLKQLEPYRLSPERLTSTTREHSALSAEVKELEKERDGLRFHLERSGIGEEEAAAIEERAAWLLEREKKAERRLRVCSAALEAMQEARRSLLSSAVPALAVSVGETFSALTGGRYEKIEVREEDLGISVYSSEKGQMIPAEEVLGALSKGTVSQLYLAARLKLVDVLSGGRKPPLIFDDSFSYFDDERLERLWALLLDVSSEQQVFVFTCSDRYDRFAGPGVNIVDLAGA